MMEAKPSEDKSGPTLRLESRPSKLTGISFWLVLAYKEHSFERYLPENFFGMDDDSRDLVIAREADALRKQLRPILLAEDRCVRLVTA